MLVFIKIMCVCMMLGYVVIVLLMNDLPTETPKDLIKEEGWIAALEGKKKEHNPYALDSVGYKSWNRGWESYMKKAADYHNRTRW